MQRTPKIDFLATGSRELVTFIMLYVPAARRTLMNENQGQLSPIAYRLSPIFVLTLLLVLAACGTRTESVPTLSSQVMSPATTSAVATATETPVTLTWSLWGSDEELAAHRRVAQSFMQAHPNITINIRHTPWPDYHQNLKKLIDSGDPSAIPDVMFLSQDLYQLVEQGALENLSPWIERTNYDVGDYWPMVIDQAKINGQIYGLQRDLDLSLLYYNKTLFHAAGVPYPTNDWTWDDWAAAAKKLTVIGQNDIPVRQGLAMEAGKWRILLAQNGGSLLDNFRNPSRCTLDTAPSRQAVQFFTDLLRSKAAMRPEELEKIGGDAVAFQQGRVAMIIQNASRTVTFNAAEIDYDVAPVPIPKGGYRVNNLGGARWVMSSHSQHKEAAWTFLSWLQSPDGGMRIYTSAGDTFPAIRSAAASWAFTTRAQKPANRNAFLLEASNTRPITLIDLPDGNYLNDSIIDPNLNKIWNGQGATNTIITEICTEMNQFLQQKGSPSRGGS